MIPISDENATLRAPVASRTIIVICCAVFLWQITEFPWGQYAALALGFTPEYFFHGGPADQGLAWVPFAATLITYMFLHAGWLHLLGNILYLWIFGDDVEDALGQPGFIVFYLLCGMIAALAQALLDPDSTVPIVGASGAISGVLGAYLMLYPRAKINVPVPIFMVRDVVRLPAFVVIAIWFVGQLLYDLASVIFGGSIAFWAHIGGFIAGMVLAPLVLRVAGQQVTRAPN